MAGDLDLLPRTKIISQLCGDAHIANFGFYGSPERQLVFDINDFDETIPGPWEWDVKRMAASIVVAGRDNGFSREASREATLAALDTYRSRMRELADMTLLEIWYEHVPFESLFGWISDSRDRRRFEAKARAPQPAALAGSGKSL